MPSITQISTDTTSGVWLWAESLFPEKASTFFKCSGNALSSPYQPANKQIQS